MTTTPLIVRVALAADWPAAFRIAWSVAFAQAAAGHGLDAGGVSLAMGDLSRGRSAAACVCRSPAAAPTTTATESWPAPGPCSAPIRAGRSGARATATRPMRRSSGRRRTRSWPTLIVAAQRYGARAKIDGDAVLAWARRWTSRDDDVRDPNAASRGTATSAASVGAFARESSRGHHARLRDDAELPAVRGTCGEPLPQLPQTDIVRMADDFLTMTIWSN
jgi:hypothetical protein